MIQKKDGEWYKMTTPVTITRSWHTSTSAARTAADGGDDFAGYKSGYVAIGPSQLIATLVSVGTPSFVLVSITEA
jgi:hypothetical protein